MGDLPAGTPLHPLCWIQELILMSTLHNLADSIIHQL